MEHSVEWRADDEGRGSQVFTTAEEATGLAGGIMGKARVTRLPVGSVTYFDHGRELTGGEATAAMLEWAMEPQ